MQSQLSTCSWSQAQLVWRSEVVRVSVLLLLLLLFLVFLLLFLLLRLLLLLLSRSRLDEKLLLGFTATVQLGAVVGSDRLHLLPWA